MTLPSVVAIGTFDGIHRGHQYVLEKCLKIAADKNLQPVILTFNPHPRDVLRPQNPIFRITQEDIKIRTIEILGDFKIETIEFSNDIANLTAQQFIEIFLIQKLNAKHVIVGHDFHFGKNRAGTPNFLSQQGKLHDFEVTLLPAYRDENNDVISSSRIRDALRNGHILLANSLLGYSWKVSGIVQHGDKRGRLLGYPTLNLHMPQNFKLKHGIYAVQVYLSETENYVGAASFGTRPQFDDGPPKLEIFCVGLNREIYEHKIIVQFIGFIRDEQKFDTVEVLKSQMARDVEDACVMVSSYKLKSVLVIFR